MIIILAAVLGFAALGPTSPRAEWQDKAETALQATPVGSQVLTEADLTGLPEVLAEYIRRSGAVGKPRVSSFFADVRGRIRGGPDKGWMEFTGHQVNTYGDKPQRFLLLNASMFGLPIAMTHLFDESSASMRGKLLSLLTVVDGSGPDMERAETVTLFNDLVVMAPGGHPVRVGDVDPGGRPHRQGQPRQGRDHRCRRAHLQRRLRAHQLRLR